MNDMDDSDDTPKSRALRFVDGGMRVYDLEGLRAPARILPEPSSLCMRADGSAITGEQWRAEYSEMHETFHAGGMVDRKGDYMFCPTGVATVLELHPYWRGTIRYNQLARAVVCGDENTQRVFATRVEYWFQTQWHFNGANPDMCRRAIDFVGHKHVYHPVREYLESLPRWDGNPRIENLVRVLGSPVDEWPLVQAYLRAWFTGAVRRVIVPGTKFDAMLVLFGQQGVMKSTFFEKLAGGKFFYNTLSDTKWDDNYTIHGSWIHEYAELESVTTKADVSRLKAHLTTKVDTAALKYEVQHTYWARSCVFVGTTNRDDILRDETGERRFWIIRCDKPIDISYVTEHRDQIWAEAMALHAAGERCYLPDEYRVVQETSIKQYKEVDVWDETIGEYLAGHTFDEISIDDILHHLKIAEKDWDQQKKNRVSKVLRNRGYSIKVVWRSGKTVKRYVREQPAADSAAGP